jgi:hypothetical protein
MRVIMIFGALGLLALVLTIAAFPLLGHFGRKR